MATLSPERMRALLKPFWPEPGGADVVQDDDNNGLIAKFGTYLALLMKWNGRTNLTAIREPEDIVRRHFGESLFTGMALGSRLPEDAEILDFGSGAGFPGLPIQLLQPAWRVTLAESQGKKAAFLREAVRTLGLTTEVWSSRVEAMPESRLFDCVTLRAVDDMESAVKAAAERVRPGGVMAILAGAALSAQVSAWTTTSLRLPESENRFLHLVVAHGAATA
jgi:16S rRNA (guanine527-N7)-methyltransferase